MSKATVARAEKGHPTVWRRVGASGGAGEFEVESESTTLLTWLVRVDGMGNCVCRGDSEGGRCWPFYQRATCKHTEAVYYVLKDEIAAGIVQRRGTALRLEDLFEVDSPRLRLESR